MLYVRGIADAILEGKANSVQEILTAVKEGEEEFVEEGKAE
jgi:small subunit ribosomal protein S2